MDKSHAGRSLTLKYFAMTDVTSNLCDTPMNLCFPMMLSLAKIPSFLHLFPWNNLLSRNSVHTCLPESPSRVSKKHRNTSLTCLPPSFHATLAFSQCDKNRCYWVWDGFFPLYRLKISSNIEQVLQIIS